MQDFVNHVKEFRVFLETNGEPERILSKDKVRLEF